MPAEHHTLTSTDLLATTIRELTEQWPATMAVLAPLGIDLCCGGGHTLGVALQLHGIEPEPVVTAIANATGLELV